MKRNVLLIVALFLIAFSLRFYDISYPDFKWMDEQGHVPAAMHYWNDGQFEPDRWEHPPLRHILLYGFLRLFGDNPYGWRMRNVLFGALAAVLTSLFAWEITRNRKAALTAGLLLATDPLHIVLSRFTFCEVYSGAVFLAAVVLFVLYRNTYNGPALVPSGLQAESRIAIQDRDRRNALIVLSAVLMGCSIAMKWNYVPGWILLLILALFQHNTYRNFRDALFISSVYFLIPLGIYILSFYQWFGRGYTFGEFIEFVTNIYYSFRMYTSQYYDQELILLSHTSAAEWFVSPIILGQGTYISPDQGEFALFVNNLPIWILTVPSMIVLAVIAVKKKSMTLALPVLLFCASYALFLFIRRPAFLYSTAPLLPFAFTAIAFTITKITDKYGPKLFYPVLAVMVSWNLFLYPLVTAKKVPIAPYEFIVNNPDVHIH